MGCVAAIAYFLTKPPEPALVSAGAAPTPAAWLHRYAELVHRRMSLMTLSEYEASVAYLQVSTGHGRTQITLYKQAGQWRAAKAQVTCGRPRRTSQLRARCPSAVD